MMGFMVIRNKTNVLLAVSAEHATPQQDAARWLEIWETGGATKGRFSDLSSAF